MKAPPTSRSRSLFVCASRVGVRCGAFLSTSNLGVDNLAICRKSLPTFSSTWRSHGVLEVTCLELKKPWPGWRAWEGTRVGKTWRGLTDSWLKIKSRSSEPRGRKPCQPLPRQARRRSHELQREQQMDFSTSPPDSALPPARGGNKLVHGLGYNLFGLGYDDITSSP